jgi:hypothetical protein
VIRVFTVITLAAILEGCSPDPDEYYVKYTIDSTATQINGKLDLFLNDENNQELNLLVPQRQLNEVIVGPVGSSFEASLLARDAGSANGLKLYANIYVSKNGSPFALKATDGSDVVRNYVSLSYTIDY